MTNMEDRNLETALLIASKLINGEEISKNGDNVALYEKYSTNAQVYDILMSVMNNFNLNFYDYNGKLFVTAGENNRVFGYSNEELKRILGLRLNKELFMCYLIIYSVMTLFYNDSANYTYLENTTAPQILDSVDTLVATLTSEKEVFNMTQTESEGFKAICLLWNELPRIAGDDINQVRASKNSRAGYIKLVMNFLMTQDLFIEENDRYYPKDRMRALIENYFEEYKGRIYEILNGEENENATH